MEEGERTVREDGGRTVREGAATVREAAATPEGGATVRERPAPPPGPSTAADAGAPRMAGWLPASLEADYRVIEALPARGGEADLYVVEPRDPADAVRRVAKVYRQGIDPKEGVLERVRDADPGHLVHVEAYGQDAGRSWVLMEYVERGSLRMFIDRQGPQLSDAVVLQVLRQLNEALTGLHRLGMEHRDLKPDNVLVRSRAPLELVLSDFGIASVMEATVHFTATARTIRYAPPEAIGGVVADEADRRGMVAIEHTTWDYWSLGMMLVEMLAGAHPFAGLSEALVAHQLATRNVDDLTEGISDPDWRRLCRGLLRRTPAARWDAEAVARWIADPRDPRLVIAEDALPAEDAGAPRHTPPMYFNGAAYTTADELGAALSREWRLAEEFWRRRYGEILTWLADGLGLPDLRAAVARIDDGIVSLDAQVFSFIHHLAPHAPPRFRDEDISPETIASLGERAVRDSDADAADTLLALYRGRIPMLAGALPNGEGFPEISDRWDSIVEEYRELGQRLRAQGAPEPHDDQLALLLAASLPDSPLVAALRDHAWDACTEDAWRCRWYRDLGSPDTASVAALVMLPYLRTAAERHGRAAKARPLRGCVGGLVTGGVFGRLVAWADAADPGTGIFNPPGFQDASVWGGVALLLLLVIVFGVAVSWYGRPSYGGAADEVSSLPASPWRGLLQRDEPGREEGE